MKRNTPSTWLLVVAVCLTSCGGGDSSSTLTPVASSEKPPRFINYPDPNMFTEGVEITPLVPTVTGGAPANYLVQPDLPAGLWIDGDGVISGTPTEKAPPTTYIVTAGNSAGTASFGVRITVLGRFTIGGMVVGLTGPGLVLTNNGDDDLAIDANGPFAFDNVFPAGYPFIIEVVAQPAGQSCSVTGGNAQVSNVDYADAVVTCGASPSI